ncbi:MAG: 50S ribosomal protein L25/general stress protein Ctc [Propionibacteriales bacterium]|nr:50S ribosomal protein L25/general stress protein Ctc [Propionibacteriales bacterium]
MSEVKIKAESRTEFGKGAARRIRRADKVPAVLYGHGAEPIHLTLPGHDAMMALKNANALFSVQMEGKEQLALAKEIQRDPIRGFVKHVDLIQVRRGEKVTVDVPVYVVGEAASDALVVTEQTTISIDAEATHIPESIEVSVEGLEIGSQVLAKDLQLPAGSSLHVDEDMLIVNAVAAPTAEQLEAELAEAEAEAGVEREEAEAVGAEPAAEPAAEAAAPAEGESAESQE